MSEKEYQRKRVAVMEAVLKSHIPATAKDTRLKEGWLRRMADPEYKPHIKRPNKKWVDRLYKYFYGDSK